MTAPQGRIRRACLSCGATLPDDGTSRKRCEEPCAREYRLEQCRQWKRDNPAATARHVKEFRERERRI